MAIVCQLWKCCSISSSSFSGKDGAISGGTSGKAALCECSAVLNKLYSSLELNYMKQGHARAQTWFSILLNLHPVSVTVLAYEGFLLLCFNHSSHREHSCSFTHLSFYLISTSYMWFLKLKVVMLSEQPHCFADREIRFTATFPNALLCIASSFVCTTATSFSADQISLSIREIILLSISPQLFPHIALAWGYILKTRWACHFISPIQYSKKEFCLRKKS